MDCIVYYRTDQRTARYTTEFLWCAEKQLVAFTGLWAQGHSTTKPPRTTERVLVESVRRGKLYLRAQRFLLGNTNTPRVPTGRQPYTPPAEGSTKPFHFSRSTQGSTFLSP